MASVSTHLEIDKRALLNIRRQVTLFTQDKGAAKLGWSTCQNIWNQRTKLRFTSHSESLNLLHFFGPIKVSRRLLNKNINFLKNSWKNNDVNFSDTNAAG